ncbi:apomixis-related protein Pca21 [Panicum miliaceum]|uniref:Apomixis-related protein Pca21 n=1 Tax=Panicum miliaceum TaxID=4540 RepID=A0A3L6PRV3_PANMI|nr:apomixis-related protein Pca21 [Panicum miliaceum]
MVTRVVGLGGVHLERTGKAAATKARGRGVPVPWSVSLPPALRGRICAPCDSQAVDSPPPTSQGGSSNGSKAIARKTKEVEHLFTNLEKEGVVIDGKIATIVDDEIARIKAEAMREAINESKRNEKMASAANGFRLALLTAASCAVGFVMGAEWLANALRKEFAKRRLT